MIGISSIFILDQKGRMLITRDYRGELPTSIFDKFNQKLIELDEFSLKPVIYDSSTKVSFFHMRHKDLYLVAAAKNEVNAVMVFSFLNKTIELFEEYFNEFEEESVRDNFVVIHELLDEIMDNGYPQLTEEKILQEYIKTESYAIEHPSEKMSDIKLPTAVSNAVSWRSDGISYKKNEIFLDVIEKLNMIINDAGDSIKAEVIGSVKMLSMLSGMPECKLGLNDRLQFEAQGKTSRIKTIDLDDVKFHQCVRLSKFENERVISFIPPDGDFELFSYRTDATIKPIFLIETTIEHYSRSKIEIFASMRANYKAKCVASYINVLIPVPCDAENPKFKSSIGKCSYTPDKDAILWKTEEVAGGKEMNMRATFSLPSVASSERDSFMNTPIIIEFEIPYFTVSGIQVRYLNVQEKSGYSAYPWVRYITQNGNYLIRKSFKMLTEAPIN